MSDSMSKDSSDDTFLAEDDISTRFPVDFNDVFDFTGPHSLLQAPGPLGCLGLVHASSVQSKIITTSSTGQNKFDCPQIDKIINKPKEPPDDLNNYKNDETVKSIQSNKPSRVNNYSLSELPGLKIKYIDGKKTYFCESCPYSTIIKKSICRHVQSVHMGIKAFKCTECEYTANYLNNIKRHVNAVHVGEKNWFCPQCPYKTGDKGHLNSHIRAVHEKLKPYACVLCKYRASKQTDLNIHVSTVHEKEKRFQCDICNLKFTKKGNLNRHLLVIHDPNKIKKRNKNVKLTCKIIKENNTFSIQNKIMKFVPEDVLLKRKEEIEDDPLIEQRNN